MWLLVLIALAEPATTALPQPRVAPVGIFGEFSNMQFSGEHSYGYTVQLWRQGDHLFGFLEASEGLAGDTPIGKLQEVQFEPRSSALSFKAKLTIGVEFVEPGRQQPSRDMFEFRGTLERTALVGTLKHWDMLRQNAKPVVSRVRLRRISSDTMIQARTYEGWKKSADELLKFRGPKW